MTATATRSLVSSLRTAPLISDPAAAERRYTDLFEHVDASCSLRHLAEQEPVRLLLSALADHSPFLWRLAIADPARLSELLATDPDVAVSRIVDNLELGTWDHGLHKAELMRALRRARQSVALLVAVADLGGIWDLERITEVLTAFADTAIRAAVRALLREAERTAKLLPGLGSEAGCGLTILALGKQGADELNYSSDVDLVALFDPRAARLSPEAEPSRFFVRLIQQFGRLLQDRTEDGYVLRVDLRLRPDPASTPVAIAIPSAFSYYESYGQNWERAAFIKARPVAGDLDLGQRFLDDLAPFIWRKYFDYAAIADVHAMKRQIHAVRGHATIGVAGHNIKLGRGGIREVEFFVQTQQLIFGGRRTQLRGRRTLAMLHALEADGWITAEAVADLSSAYRFLRTVEHRLQMVADEQTQTLPDNEAGLDRLARFAGFPDRASFAAALTGHLTRVEAHYARLFEHAPALDSSAGSLVFTGTAADPETRETLRTMGFIRPDSAIEIIRGWHFGRRPGIQSGRAREVLTELTPALLEAFAGSSDPDAALATMDTLLGRVTSAVELLSLLRSNTAVRELFADIVGSAPRLAATIAARPHILDAAIDPAVLRGADPDHATRVARHLEQATSTEDFLDRTRDLVREEQFLIGLRLLSGAEPAQRTGEAFTRLADLVVEASLDRCLADFAEDHGRVPGGACMVLGMGKLGSREMTATSDLDLILIYRFDPGGGPSDGPKPLEGTRYYTRLTQRLIAALTAPTRRGRLYDVDVRLRPSGRQGPLAVQLAAFVNYQAQEAQTWERMALSRARPIAGDAGLAADVTATIRAAITVPREPAQLQADIRGMRALVAQDKGDADFWDVKLVVGGLLDIEFAAQFLVLRHAPRHPSLLHAAPAAVIAEARRLSVLPESDAETLLDAYRLQTAVAQLTRLTVEGRFEPGKAGAGVMRRLCAAANQPDFSALQSELTDGRAAVRGVLRRLLDWEG